MCNKDFENDYDTKKLRAEIKFLETALQEIKWTRDSLREYVKPEIECGNLTILQREAYKSEIRSLILRADAHLKRINTLDAELVEAAAMWDYNH